MHECVIDPKDAIFRKVHELHEHLHMKFFMCFKKIRGGISRVPVGNSQEKVGNFRSPIWGLDL